VSAYPNYFAVLGIDPHAADWAIPAAVQRAKAEAESVFGRPVPDTIEQAAAVLLDEQARLAYRRLLEIAEVGHGSVRLPADVERHVASLDGAEFQFMHFRMVARGGGVYEVERLPLDVVPTATGSAGRGSPADNPPPRMRREPEAYGMVNGQPPPLVLGRRVFNWSEGYAELKQAVDMGDSVHLVWQTTDTGVEWVRRDYQAPFYKPEAYVAGCRYFHLLLTDPEEREPRTQSMFAVNPPDATFRPVLCWTGMLCYFPWSKHPGLKDPNYLRYREANYFGFSLENRRQRDDIIYRYVEAVTYWTLVYAWPDHDPSELRSDGRDMTAQWLYQIFGWPERTLRKRYGLQLRKG